MIIMLQTYEKQGFSTNMFSKRHKKVCSKILEQTFLSLFFVAYARQSWINCFISGVCSSTLSNNWNWFLVRTKLCSGYLIL